VNRWTHRVSYQARPEDVPEDELLSSPYLGARPTDLAAAAVWIGVFWICTRMPECEGCAAAM
jgi:hypothetical protein